MRRDWDSSCPKPRTSALSRMGIFLIFFSHEDHRRQSSPNNPKSTNFNLFSLTRSNSAANLLFKAQSTISLCALLLFTTLLLFTLSTLPANSSAAAAADYSLSRRKLGGITRASASPLNHSSCALQGMGSLYRKGTRAMSGLVVVHAVESLTLHEFELFIRLLYRSSIASGSDLIFVFPSKSAAFDRVIREENDLLMKLLDRYSHFSELNTNQSTFSSFEATHFVKNGDERKETGEPIWGRKIRGNFSQGNGTESTTQLSYGSVVGFDVDELDPENSLSGFLDHVPMNLRRWACYPMLLGRVRRNFKHVALVDIKEMLLLDDPFDKSATATIESVFLATQSTITGKHGKRSSEKSHHKPVTPAIITGGARGIRRLSSLMLIEIVRASMHKKRKHTVTEQLLFNQLVGNRFVLKNLEVFVSLETIPELGSVMGSDLAISRSKLGWLVRRGNSNAYANSILMKHICSFPIDSTIYSECYEL